MKNISSLILSLLLIESTEAVSRHHRNFPGVTFLPDDSFVMGIDKGDLMQNNPSHWRKAWPEGIDNGQDDADVLGRLDTKRRSHKDKEKPVTYPWSYDEDVIHTGKSLAMAEDMTGKQMTKDGVGYSHRGIDWVSDINFFKFSRTNTPPPTEE